MSHLFLGLPGQPGEELGEDPLVQDSDMVFGDPNVGQSTEDEYSTVIRGIKSPREMTPEQFENHCLTHLPYDEACVYCARSKKPNIPHKRSPG